MFKHLLNVSDLSKKDLNEILDHASSFELKNSNCLINKNIGLIFEKSSTRTRISFQVGIRQLGGNYIDIRFEELNLQRFESYEDTFEIMSCYLDCLVFRTTDHKKLTLAQEYFKKPIINALSDVSHPCQAISDIFTLYQHFGKNINLNIIWMGDINNVLFSLIEIINLIDNVKLDIFTDKEIYIENKNIIPLNDQINIHFELKDEIFKSANCIMTDVFNSMNDKENKEPKLKNFQVNKKIMSLSPKAVFMHCLPAKIDSEVTLEVLKSDQSIVKQQAKNRLVAQRGILQWLNI